MTLAAALSRLSKPRAKGTADENSGTNTSTSSSRSTSNGQAGADAGGRSAAATTQTTADATNGAVDPDQAKTAEARRDDAGTNGQRAERADHRTRDNGNGRAPREAEAATAEDSSAQAVEDRLDDQKWLASLNNIRQKLADSTQFDQDALLWRHLRPGIDGLIRLVKALGRDAREAMAEAIAVCRYPWRVASLIGVAHPRAWDPCRFCNGKGREGREKEALRHVRRGGLQGH